MGKIKRLAGETLLYGLGSIVPRFLNFLLVTVHTERFEPEAYGIITKLFAYAAVVNILLMLGMETAYFRYASKSPGDEKKVFNAAQTFLLVISLIISLSFILFAQPLAVIMSIPGQSNIIVWFAIILFIDAAVAIPFARLRIQKKALLFAAGKLSNIAILVGLNYYFLYLAFDPSIGVGFVVLANLIANGVYLIFFARMLFSWRPEYDSALSSSMLRYAYPVMLTGLAGMTNEMFSRLTLEWWLPPGFYKGQSSEYALGIFGACYKFAVLMNLVIQAFR